MKFRYKLLNFLQDSRYKVEMLFLGVVLKVLPDFEPKDPKRCKHKWLVDSVDYQSISLLLVCYNCNSNGVVNDPDEQEWEDAYGVSMKSYNWHDNQRAVWISQWKN